MGSFTYINFSIVRVIDRMEKKVPAIVAPLTYTSVGTTTSTFLKMRVELVVV